jgi:hypothetical protein
LQLAIAFHGMLKINNYGITEYRNHSAPQNRHAQDAGPALGIVFSDAV